MIAPSNNGRFRLSGARTTRKADLPRQCESLPLGTNLANPYMRRSMPEAHESGMSDWLIFCAIVLSLWGALLLIWLQIKRRGG